MGGCGCSMTFAVTGLLVVEPAGGAVLCVEAVGPLSGEGECRSHSAARLSGTKHPHSLVIAHSQSSKDKFLLKDDHICLQMLQGFYAALK